MTDVLGNISEGLWASLLHFNEIWEAEFYSKAKKNSSHARPAGRLNTNQSSLKGSRPGRGHWSAEFQRAEC